MIIHGGKTWKTLEDKMYHGGKKIEAVYKGGVKYYPEGGAKPYLTFYSPDGEFTLKVYDNAKHWDGTLEWSTDAETWTEWPGTTTLSSSGGYLYMRGSGNSKITGNLNAWDSRWVVAGGHIECRGNIESLLDHTHVASGLHPVMSTYCYAYMFGACANLTTAPELPATTLAQACYQDMFEHCTSLTTAPELPATTLASYCYEYMFFRCTSLTIAPELPATTLESGCYRYMFGHCTSLRISATSDPTYRFAFRIPTSGTGTVATGALTGMFGSTGGPFTGDPTINTTYYTDHEPV